MPAYKAIIQYKGTHFKGWQTQLELVRTVQGEVLRVLKEMTKDGEVKCLGSGRTDAGVHSFGQTVRLDLPFDIAAEGLRRGMNSLLDPDVRVREIVPCAYDFHPQISATAKEYCYLFSGGVEVSPLLRDFIVETGNFSHLSEMIEAAQLFEGEHDFANYFTVGTEVSSTVRTIFSCKIEQGSSLLDPAFYQMPYLMLRVKGSGFLKQMVRLMMGALWEVGRGKIAGQDIINSLSAQKMSRHLSAVTPPHGLILNRVWYAD